MNKFTDFKVPLGLTLIALTLHGCGKSSSNASTTPAAKTYVITLTNVTANQPIAPVAMVLHTGGYQGWAAGAAASAGLEMLAEGGDNATFLSEAQASADTLETATATGAIAPGGSETITVTATDSGSIQLTAAGMLVNTNDAFSGLDGLSLDGMAVGSSILGGMAAHDAGTEADTETTATMPGTGGTGFDATRDDTNNFVTLHPGVVTSSDGLVTSALDQSHRFDNPVMRVSVKRTN